MPFDVNSARKEGYSDTEIADYLAKENKFDAAAARNEGYSDTEIIQYLGDQEALADTSVLKEAWKGTKAGWQGANKAVGSVLEYTGELTGAEPLKNIGKETSDYWGKLAEGNKARVSNFTDIKDATDFAHWASWNIGQMGSQIAVTAPFMVVGAPAEGSVGGFTAAKELLTKGNVSQFGKFLSQWAKPKAMDIPIGILEAGQVAEGQLDRLHKGETKELDPIRGLAATFVATKLEELGAENMVNRLFTTGTTGAKGKLFRRIGQNALATGFGEGPEEFFQQYAEQAGIDPKKLGTKEAFMDAVNGAAAGFIGGVAIGGVTGGASRNNAENAPAGEQTQPMPTPIDQTLQQEQAPEAQPAIQKPTSGGQFDDIIQASSAKHGVDPALVKAVIQAESGFKNDLTSPKGAAGLMQLMPGTAKMLGVNDVMDPVQNIDAGTEYLAGLLKRFSGDEQKALAAYNWGPGNVIKRGIENAPKETRDYIARVQGNRGSAGTTAEVPQTEPQKRVLTLKDALQSGKISLQDAINQRNEITSEFPETEDEINKAIIDAQASRPLTGGRLVTSIESEGVEQIQKTEALQPEISPVAEQDGITAGTEAQTLRPDSITAVRKDMELSKQRREAKANEALQTETAEIDDLQSRIEQQQRHIDANQGYKGTEIYKIWQDNLAKDKARLSVLTEGIPVLETKKTPTTTNNLPSRQEIVAPEPISQAAATSKPTTEQGVTKAAKEPWQMTRDEWRKTYPTDKARDLFADTQHRQAISEALSIGEKVPDNVLSEYPGIEKEVELNNERIASLEKQKTDEELLRTNKANDVKQNIEQKQKSDIEQRRVLAQQRLTTIPLAQLIKESGYKTNRTGVHDLIKEDQRKEIQRALSEGRQVPPEVLKDYPDLNKSVSKESLQPGESFAAPEPVAVKKPKKEAKPAKTEGVIHSEVTKEQGRQAFRDGKKRVPPSSAGMKRKAEWLEGWDEENLKTPVEKETTPIDNEEGQIKSPYAQIADFVKEKLKSGDSFTSAQLFAQADLFFGGTQANGMYTPKDAYDALELGVNKYIEDAKISPAVNEKEAEKNVLSLKETINNLPTQTKRTKEQDQYQQFSTPPPLAYVANWVANIQKGEQYLEPSAGIGGIAVFGKVAGADVIVNELSARRAEVLKEMDFDRIFTENAEQLNNILPADVKPSVIVMNPPFSATAGRVSKTNSMNGAAHLEQALKRLDNGGRLVTIMGEGMAADRPAFTAWWNKIKQIYNVRANIGINGQEYKKYGTTFDNQIIVIDKTGATTDNVLTGKVDKIEDLVDFLKGVRDARTYTGKQFETESNSQENVAAGKGNTRPEPPILSSTGKMGDREQQVSDGTRANRADQFNAGVEATESNGVHRESEREQGQNKAGRRETEAGRSGVGDSGLDRGQVGNADRIQQTEANVKVESKKPAENKAELSDSVYESYTPAKLEISGAKKHPGNLVESAAMGAVTPPDISYQPNIPISIVKEGRLSDAQLEAIVYAGQSHSQFLPGNEVRRGYFIGDGTGVGKGREISGIILDNWNSGRKKAVWISQNSPLINDARRDAEGVGLGEDKIFDFGKIKAGKAVTQKEGVAFLGYDTLRAKGKDGSSRLQQLVDWFGTDYDGVIVFDEAHNMGNAVTVKKARGTSKPSMKALSGVELQKLLPKARIVYVSATGATEVMNLAYADRLGLWGEGTPFANKADFIEKISAGGIAAMELVARDMKSMGNYLARSLSYEDVKYEKLEHPLTPDQRVIYDEMATAWQLVLKNINNALEKTGGDKNGAAKSAAMSQFWGSHQRFFNQIITSMQTPSVIKSIENDIKNGHAAIIQLVNTNEAAQERALARMEEGDELEDLDMTPREQLMEYVRNGFPVAQYEERQDENGNTIMVPVKDSNGNPVENADAVAMREELLNKLGGVKVPDGPLEMLLNHFGAEKVAEITGRNRRVVEVTDDTGRHRVVEKRSKAKAMVDADAFMNDKKQILVFSNAGGTGRSYHADLTAANQRLRRHYLLQAGWRADAAIQGFGRSHRSNQKQAPEYVLVTTDVIGQKRFISSIARRLDQLGALTKGQRETGSGGFFTARDNLESEYAQNALIKLVQDIYAGSVPGMTMSEFSAQTGLDLIDQKDGSLNVTKIPPIPTFLNRLLSMTLDYQKEVFGHFSERMDTNIRRAMESGTLDVGLETLRAKKVEKVQEQTVYTDPSGAETKYVQLNVTNDANYLDFNTANVYSDYSTEGFYQNIKSGKIWGASSTRAKTNTDTGSVELFHRLVSPTRSSRDISPESLKNTDKYIKLSDKEAQKLWDAEFNELPREITYPEHMITGTLLPIWDRLPGGRARIMRVQTADGERMIGRLIDAKSLQLTLQALGASANATKVTPEEIFNGVKFNGMQYELANGWKIVRRKVSGEQRIELIGPDYRFQQEISKYGAFIERINWQTRLFIPTSEDGIKAIERIVSNRPVINVIAPVSVRENMGESTEEEPQYSRTVRRTTGMKAENVQKVADKVTGFLKNAPKANIVQQTSEIPAGVLENMREQGILDENGDSDVQGFAWKGETWLVANNLDSPQEVVKILMHELTHDGLGKFFSTNTPNIKLRSIRLQYKSLMDAIYQAHEKEVKKIARTTHTHLDISTLAGQRAAAEEWLCNQTYEAQPKWYDRLVSVFNDIMRAIGFDVKLSDSEVRTVLQDAFKVFGDERGGVRMLGEVPEDKKTSFARSGRTLSIDEIIDKLIEEETAAPEAMPAPGMKESRAAIRLEKEAIARELTADFGQLAGYSTMNMQEQADMAQDVMNSDYELAKRMAMGEIKPPPGVREASMYEAVKIRALDEGDVDTLQALATESTVPTILSQYGQAIKAADSYLMADPVKAMQEVIKDRIEKAKRTKGAKAAQAGEVIELRKKLEEAEKKLADYEAKRDEKQAKEAIDEIIKAPRKKKKVLGQKNKIVTLEEFQKLREKMRGQASGTQLNALPDPTMLADLAKMGVFYLEAGIREFADWSKNMVEDVGEWVKPHTKEIYDESLGLYHDGIVQGVRDDVRQALAANEDSDIGRYANELAKHFIEMGVTEREELIDKVHDVLHAEIPDLTRRDTMDAISGYGKYKQLDKDEILVKLRDIKGQLLQIAKLEDMQQGNPLLKTGFERQEKSDEERRLVKLVEDAKKKYGVVTIDKERQLKSALDALKTRLENQIKDLQWQIDNRKKIVPVKHDIKRDAQAKALERKRDALKVQYNEIFGKPGLTDVQRQNIAIKALERSIVDLYRRIQQKDLSPMKKPVTPVSSPRIDMLRAEKEKLKKEYKELKDLANPKKTPEEIALKSLKTRLKNEAKKYSEMLDNLNFEPRQRRQVILDAEGKKLKEDRDRIKQAYQEASKVSSITKEEAENIVKLSKIVSETKENLENGGNRFEYGAARVAFERYVEHLKGRDSTLAKMLSDRMAEFKTTYKEHQTKAIYELLRDSIQTVADTSISLVASLDNSFIGRQGLKVLFTHPTVWWPAARESFRDIYKVMRGQDAIDALMADVYSRPNCLNGSYDLAKLIPKSEEQFPVSFPERVPYVGRVFKASMSAFEGAAIRMRTDLFDLLAKTGEEAGENVTDKVWVQDVGKLVSSLTARGSWGKRGEPAIVRVILWAPKMLKANLDVLTAHGAGAGLETSFARKQAAFNLLKIVGSTAVLMAAAAAMGADVEDDPRSTDFGKIKVGDTRFDITGGAASIITLAARLLTGSYKSASSGLVKEYGSKYADRTRWDAFIDFLMNKTSPPARVVVDMLKGRNWKGEPFTWSGAAYQALTPISIQNAIQLKDKATADRIVGVLADVVGINTQSFTASEKAWDEEQSKEMKQFHDRIGAEKFKEANQKYNDRVNSWYDRAKNSYHYQKLTDDQKAEEWRKERAKAKKAVFREYHFWPKRTKKN